MKVTISVEVEVEVRQIYLNNELRFDYSVLYHGRVLDSSCNGKYKSEIAANRAGVKAAKESGGLLR